MKNIIIKTISAAMLMTALSGCGKDTFDKPDYYTRTASTEFGQKVVDGSGSCISHVKTDNETKLMDGVTLLDMGWLNAASHAMQMYIYRIELAPAMVKVSIPDDGTKVEKTQKMTEQAMAIENNATYLVMGGISGSAFTADSGAPKGILYRNGKAISSKLDKDAAFFAIMKDGAAVCLEAEEFDSKKDKITEGLSGPAMILKNGYVLGESDATETARTAVGVDEGGNTVWLAAVDGGDFFYSNGIGCADMAQILKGCGAYSAMTLNTGNNVTAFIRNENAVEMFEVINKPSNMGLEAEVGNGLVIVQY